MCASRGQPYVEAGDARQLSDLLSKMTSVSVSIPSDRLPENQSHILQVIYSRAAAGCKKGFGVALMAAFTAPLLLR